MTGTDTPIGEDDLQAYVDGRLGADRRARVEARLADDPVLRDEVEADRRRRDALRAVLAGKAAEPIPPRLRIDALRAELRRRRQRRLTAAAAAVMLFAAGGGLGAWATLRWAGPVAIAARPAATRVADDAGAAWRTYVVEVAHPVEVDATREDHLMRWLSKRLGRRLVAPDLGRFGWRLMGGRLLPGAAGAAAQLMYEDGTGGRLAVYVQAAHDGETAFRIHTAGDATTCAWIDGGFGFAVTAVAPRDRLLAIAEAIYHGFEGGDAAAGSRG